MGLIALCLAILVIVIASLVIKIAIKRAKYVKALQLFSGPKPLPVLGNAIDFMVPMNRLVDVIDEHVRENKHPYITWIGPFAILNLVQPQHVEVVLSSSKHIDKQFHYKFLEPWLGTGLLTSTGNKWHSHRKLITPAFHFKILENFVEVFAEKSEILVKKLKKEVGGRSFNIYPYITKCALDIICETAMGTEINAQMQEVDSDYVKAIYDLSEATFSRFFKPWLYLDFVFKWSASGRKSQKCINILHNFTNTVIKERKLLHNINQTSESSDEDLYLGKKKRKAFLDLLLEASASGTKLTDEELREEVDTFMFEGHDTTTAAMCWALQLLGAHPEVQEKVHEELDYIFQESDRSPTMKDLAEMKYLERVIKETLRLYPSVPGIGRILNEDIEMDGYKIPAGVQLTIIIYFVHRNPEIYPEPEKFDPDRFLPEKVASRHPYAYVPFSAGPRNCIGQKFALLEEKTVLSYILRHYTVRAVEKKLTAMPGLVLRSENGVHVFLTSRKRGR